MSKADNFQLSCPIPDLSSEKILLGHGSGGKLMQDILEKLILPNFDNAPLSERHDGALISMGDQKLAFSTDSYVVKPLFFPGGDIGKLAVYGTVNDLAMCGAQPLFLSCSLILEEGFPTRELARIIASMKTAAQTAGVQIVTGDTKVVERGKGDGLFINTAGIGLVGQYNACYPGRIQEGSCILINGDIGRHGMAVMSMREGLEFESPLKSDCQDLSHVVGRLQEAGIDLQCLRDLTRGGLASNLKEISEAADVSIEIEESEIPVSDLVKAACEILGLDPLYVACEGRMVVFVPEKEVPRAIEIMSQNDSGSRPYMIGKVKKTGVPHLILRSRLGTERVLDSLRGELLPRIC